MSNSLFPYMYEDEVCEYLQCPKQVLSDLNRTGQLIRYKENGYLFWKRDEVRAYAQKKELTGIMYMPEVMQVLDCFRSQLETLNRKGMLKKHKDKCSNQYWLRSEVDDYLAQHAQVYMATTKTKISSVPSNLVRRAEVLELTGVSFGKIQSLHKKGILCYRKENKHVYWLRDEVEAYVEQYGYGHREKRGPQAKGA